jgi:hypothetical protein
MRVFPFTTLADGESRGGAGGLDRRVADRARRGAPRSSRGACPERLALEQFRDVVGRIVMRAKIVNGEDVRLIERRRGACFHLKPMKPIGVGGKDRREDFDRDIAAEARIAGAVDLADAAGAAGGQDLIRAEMGAWGQGHSGRREYIGRKSLAETESVLPDAAGTIWLVGRIPRQVATTRDVTG